MNPFHVNTAKAELRQERIRIFDRALAQVASCFTGAEIGTMRHANPKRDLQAIEDMARKAKGRN
jgi:hypothetical protein